LGALLFSDYLDVASWYFTGKRPQKDQQNIGYFLAWSYSYPLFCIFTGKNCYLFTKIKIKN